MLRCTAISKTLLVLYTFVLRYLLARPPRSCPLFDCFRVQEELFEQSARFVMSVARLAEADSAREGVIRELPIARSQHVPESCPGQSQRAPRGVQKLPNTQVVGSRHSRRALNSSNVAPRAEHRPTFGQLWPIWVFSANAGRFGPVLGQSRPALADVGHTLTSSDPEWPMSAKIPAHFGQDSSKFDQRRPVLDQLLPTSASCNQHRSIWMEFGPGLGKFGQKWSNLA